MKTISFTVILCILILSLSSCGLIKINSDTVTTPESTHAGTTAGFDETDPSTELEPQIPPTFPDPQEWVIRESEADAMLENVIHLDFTGSTLFIADATKAFSHQLVENNVYSEALYERYEKIKSRYGFNITVISVDNSTLFEEYKSTLASGNTYSDLLSVPIRDTGRYITSGLIKNMRTLAFFDTKPAHAAPYFSSVNSAGNDIYFSVGYSSVTPEDIAVTYFNKTLLADAGIDLYNEILCGEFTIERYNEIIRTCELNSMISPSLDADLIALEMSGCSFFATGYGTTISINETVACSTLTQASSYLSSLLYGGLSDINTDNDLSVFERGDAAFRFGILSDIEEIYDDKVMWGIAPMPKYLEADSYVTPINNSAACLMVPSNTTKAEMTSIAISALNAASYKWLLDCATFHYAAYFLPDLSAIEVIKSLTDNIRFNFAAGAVSLSSSFKSVLFDSMRLYAIDPSTDLSQILTSKNLKAITTELKKYYS